MLPRGLVAGRITAPGQRLHSPYVNQSDVAEHISKLRPQIVAFFAFRRQQGGCRARAAGLARIYGTHTPLPDGRDSREYLAYLRELESEAKAAKRGAWGKMSL